MAALHPVRRQGEVNSPAQFKFSFYSVQASNPVCQVYVVSPLLLRGDPRAATSASSWEFLCYANSRATFQPRNTVNEKHSSLFSLSLQVMVVGMYTHGPVDVDGKRREACLSHESPERTWIYCRQVF